MILLDVFIIILGLVLGSFLLTMVERLQSGVSVWKRSCCDSCQKPVSIVGLIPLLGYALLAGKCKECGSKISVIYPLAEIFNALFVFAVYLKTGWSIDFIYFLAISEAFLFIAVVDFQSKLIFPQPIVFGLLVQGIWLFGGDRLEILNSLLGLLLGAGFFHWIAYLYKVTRNKVGLGEGDATLLGLIGFVFGWKILLPIAFWGAILGIIGGGATLIINKQSLRKEIAFGPWLVLAAFLTWYFPDFFQSFPVQVPDNIQLLF